MSEHVLYSKPLIVTEEKLKEVLQKQMKQRALKEALDKQIEQTKLRKQENNVEKKKINEIARNGIAQRYTLNFENGRSNFVWSDTDGPESCEDPKKTTSPAMDMPSFRRVPVDPVPVTRLLYNANSLPPNFAMGTSEANPLAPKRDEHETYSLPINFICANSKSNDDLKNASPKLRDVIPRVVASKCSPETGELMGEAEYQTNCLPRNFNLEDVKNLLQSQQPQQRQQLQSVASGMVPVKNSSGVISSPFIRHNPAHRHPGGPLPPLEVMDVANGRKISRDVSPEKNFSRTPSLELVGAQPPNGKHTRQLRPKQPSAPRGRSVETRGRPIPAAVGQRNGPTRVAEKKMEQLQRELKFREVEMAKMREKERNWEEQVRQLKIELKSARKKERDLNKLVKEGPRRAETAPDKPIVSEPVLGSPGPHGKKGVGNPSLNALGKRQNFSKNSILGRETFRPISAPSDTVATSYVPAQGDILPSMQESFKLASVLTRKTAFGLPEELANRPVPIEYEHLLQFVNEQIITQQQASALWRLFTNEESPLALLHRQPGTLQPMETSVVALNGTYLTTEGVAHDVIGDKGKETVRKETLYIKGKEEKEKEKEKEKEAEEEEEEEEEELNYSSERSFKESETMEDTFETFAELRLNNSFSQEETGDD